VFAAPWLARRLGCRVVVIVRSPVGVVSSYKRLGWAPNLAGLLGQPALLRDWLEPFRADIAAALARPDDPIGKASLLWRAVYATVAAYRDQVPGLEMVRHEDLSLDPVPAFAKLYDRLGLPFGERVERAVVASSSGASGQAAHRWSLSWGGVYKSGARPLDSRAHLEVWKERLRPEEIARIRDLTADVASLYGYATENGRP
jgi:hypothetical protein